MDYNKVIKLIKDTLPERLDKRPSGKFTTVIGEGDGGYAENEEYKLCISLQVTGDILDVSYYGE